MLALQSTSVNYLRRYFKLYKIFRVKNKAGVTEKNIYSSVVPSVL